MTQQADNAFQASLTIHARTDVHIIYAEADSMDELLERLGTHTDTIN